MRPQDTRQARRQRERYARYCALRDQEVSPADAGQQIGVSETTQRRYERARRERHGLPRRNPGWTA